MELRNQLRKEMVLYEGELFPAAAASHGLNYRAVYDHNNEPNESNKAEKSNQSNTRPPIEQNSIRLVLIE